MGTQQLREDSQLLLFSKPYLTGSLCDIHQLLASVYKKIS